MLQQEGEPQNYMFGEMRSALNIPKEVDILDHIYSLPDDKQQEAHEKIQAIERGAMAKQIPQAGLVSLMEFLDRHNIKKGICTRNFDMPVMHLLEKHLPGHISPFAPIITRDFRPPKPSPAGILHIAHAWNLVGSASVPDTPPDQRPLPLLMVGDSVDDMAAGREAGCLTVLLRSEGKEELEDDSRTDVAVSRQVKQPQTRKHDANKVKRLDELIGMLERGVESRRYFAEKFEVKHTNDG